ncbi:MAG: TetR/AcrR family transcriptional regulator [Anaerolineae bacterium]|nr:TetR/AcrR family transcriptional regulator [Anaerolineae bacterium]
MAFGKSGRPAEDRLLRQREIYEAVSPLILDHGARQLSMRMAARAACLSIGGLYHHFPTKRDLVLHGLQTEAIARKCQDFHHKFGNLADSDPAAYLDAYLDFVADSIGFVQPAVQAALELGLESLENALEPTLAAANAEFAVLCPAAFPNADQEDVVQLGRAIHRAIFSALFDKNITPKEFRREIATLIKGYIVTQQAATAITSTA